jgi:Acetyltransferase (GNAT) domain
MSWKPRAGATPAVLRELIADLGSTPLDEGYSMNKQPHSIPKGNKRNIKISYRIAREHEHDAIQEVAKTSKFLHDFNFRVIWSPPKAYAAGWIRVAEYDGQIVGFISYVPKRSRALFINHMGVHPQYRRQGIGRGLIEMVDATVPVTASRAP